MPGESQVLPRLTSLRWYAALAVFLYHLGNVVHWPPLVALAHGGQAGVSFFFVLSGFVLTWTYRGPRAAFYRRRFARIYPATLVTVLVAAALRFHGAGWLIGNGRALVAQILLVQTWVPGRSSPQYSFNSVTWTLSCEAFFYAVLPVVLSRVTRWHSRRLVRVPVALLAGAAVATALLLSFGPRWAEIGYCNPVIRFPEFALGMALAVLVQRGWHPQLRMSAAFAALVACAGLAALVGHYPVQDYVLLPGLVAVLVSAIGSDLAGRGGWLTSRRSVYLGELSFSFYLVHWLVLTGTAFAFGWVRFHPYTYLLVHGAAGLVPLLLCFVPALVAAVVLHRFVELPAQRLLSGRVTRSGTTVPTEPIGTTV